MLNKCHTSKIEFYRVKNDVNGNPRYVCHFLDCLPDSIRSDYSKSISDRYNEALFIARKIGGKKFHNKQFGGGIVFQSYNLDSTEEQILDLINSI